MSFWIDCRFPRRTELVYLPIFFKTLLALRMIVDWCLMFLAITSYFSYCIDCLIDWSIDWLIAWLNFWLSDRNLFQYLSHKNCTGKIILYNLHFGFSIVFTTEEKKWSTNDTWKILQSLLLPVHFLHLSNATINVDEEMNINQAYDDDEENEAREKFRVLSMC